MSDEHSAWLDEREMYDDRPSRSELVEDGSYEITLTVSGVKDEHAAYVASQLFLLQRLFKLDGSNVETSVTAERNRDGIERIYNLIPSTKVASDDEHPF